MNHGDPKASPGRQSDSLPISSAPAEVADDGELRFRLTLHYDGGAYHGWQVQPEVATVQGAIEAVIQRLVGTRRPVVGSGRTDTGVHATGQVAAVQLPARWTASRLRSALNGLLPRDIWVAAAQEVHLDFHPRYDAIDRTYRYRVGVSEQSRSPFVRRWCWPLAKQPDLDLLEQASQRLIGDHSFKSFSKAGQPERGDRCTVYHARWSHQGDELRWTVTANRYLHHMVRYLVGTMIDIGLGRRAIEDLDELLADSDRPSTTSKPAPPEGLYLHRVRYPGDAPPPDDIESSHPFPLHANAE